MEKHVIVADLIHATMLVEKAYVSMEPVAGFKGTRQRFDHRFLF